MKHAMAVALGLVALAAGSAQAQDQQDRNAAARQDRNEATPKQTEMQNGDENTQVAGEDAVWVDITAWDTESLYRGWSAEELLDEEVYGENGEEIGEVEDYFIGGDGRITHVIVEGGGVLDIGDSHIAIPWDQVTRIGTASIRVPVSEDNVGEYGFAEVDDEDAPGQAWRLREMLGDYLTLQNDTGYGTVRDVIFNNDGKIEAVVADPAFGYGYGTGPVAFPYNRNYDPYGPSYRTPYTRTQLENATPLNYGEFE